MNKQWKQLDVAKLQKINRRVPLSFKIDSEFKFDLYQEALNRKQDISGYIRSIIEEREKIMRYSLLQVKYKELQDELSNFRFQDIEELFENFKGKEIVYLENGIEKSKTISKLADVYFIIVKSFKITQQ